MKHKNLFPISVLIIFSFLICVNSLEGGRRKRRSKRLKKTQTVEIKLRPDSTTIKPPIPTKKDSIPKQKSMSDLTPIFFPVEKWPGETFILLEKIRMFQKFGYELYLTPHLSPSSTPINSRIELKSRRLRYELLKNSFIHISSVKQLSNGEYLVSATSDKLGVPVYGKTKEGIIEGLAHMTDKELAKKRWLNKSIYSRRRCIDLFDSTRHTFSNIKVPVTEALKVIDVRWGIVPLPPQLLWLVVERTDKTKGVIPVNVSFTNVIRTQDQYKFPWESALFEKNPKEIYSWDAYTWETINKHSIFIGMSPEQVRLSWGEPKKHENRRDEKGDSITIFIYEGKKLTFKNNALIATSH